MASLPGSSQSPCLTEQTGTESPYLILALGEKRAQHMLGAASGAPVMCRAEAAIAWFEEEGDDCKSYPERKGI